MYTNELGRRLRTLRRDRGYDTRELAEKAGVSHAYISRLENGLVNPKLLDILAVAHALEVSAAGLMELADDSEANTSEIAERLNAEPELARPVGRLANAYRWMERPDRELITSVLENLAHRYGLDGPSESVQAVEAEPENGLYHSNDKDGDCSDRRQPVSRRLTLSLA